MFDRLNQLAKNKNNEKKRKKKIEGLVSHKLFTFN